MTTQSMHRTAAMDAQYRAAHTKMMRFLAIYHYKTIDHLPLDDLDEYLLKVVSPAMGAPVDPELFDAALVGYGNLCDVTEGNHADLRRNGSGTVDNTLWLLDQAQEFLDSLIRDVLNNIGVR